MNENVIIYDWLSFSSKVHTVKQIKKIIGFADVAFQEIYGFYGYGKRITYEGVSILYDGHMPDMGVMVDMSGQGCRTFETLGTGDWESSFELIKRGQEKKRMNISRLDIAYDDHEGIIDARGTNLTAVQAQEMIARAEGSYSSKTLPGLVQVWTNQGMIVGGK